VLTLRGGWIEGAAILAAVMLVSTVTALNDYNKEQQFAALSSLDADKKIKVCRVCACVYLFVCLSSFLWCPVRSLSSF
jgi:hypothetical protein